MSAPPSIKTPATLTSPFWAASIRGVQPFWKENTQLIIYNIYTGEGHCESSTIQNGLIGGDSYVSYTVDVGTTTKDDLDTRFPSLFHGRVKYGQAFLKY